MNILITGVHGFVGSNLVRYLSKEHTIFGLDIVNPQKEGVKATFSWEALDAEGALPDIDAVIHLAGKAHVGGRRVFQGEYRPDEENLRLVYGFAHGPEVRVLLHGQGGGGVRARCVA